MKIIRLMSFCLLVSSASITLASDVGKVHLPNSGSAAAQRDFHHGLAQLHNFEYESAARDFRRARKIDPDFALAYWGEAMTHNHPIWMQQDRDAAVGILKELGGTGEAQLASAKTELEKDFLHAAQILYGKGDKKTRDFLYRDHMAIMHEKYPEQADVGAFYALSLMGTAHNGRDFSTYMQSAAVSTALFAENPQHPGLAHYLIHATDDPIHAPLGYSAALAYSKIAPNAAHAQHMTSHIFLALGHWQATADANDNAVAVVNRQRAASGSPSLGCGHYPGWQMYAYLQQGRLEEATTRMKLCHRRTAEGNGSVGSLQAFYYMKELYLSDTEDWNGEVAKLDVDFDGNEATAFHQRYIEATRALHSDNDNAERLTSSALAAGDKYLAMLTGGDDSHAHTLASVRNLQLRARQSGTAGNHEQAETLWRKAVTLEKALPFGFGPPSPAKPSLEAFGDFLLARGRYDEAAEIYREALSRTLNRTRTKQGLALALEHAGTAEDIARY